MSDAKQYFHEKLQREQSAAYLRRGPIWGRLRELLTGIAVLAAMIVVNLLLTTLAAFYPGTGVVKPSPREQPATATVRQCEQAGPVSSNGFGYWWECDVTVRMRDGRAVETAVGHSVVTPDDRGRPVEFREACFGANNTECHYGRPTWLLWGIAVSVVGMVRVTATILALMAAGVSLLRAILGVPRYFAWINRRKSNSG
ncbi:DUF6346 domain-containing protein [Micromonospora sp. NPDC006766]|uniref:DUF6346 domain-containing protein n=1 Tax=Micromonospora sp. NPDC006766 TaxID=3154778 RepID=UPI0033F4FB3D